MPRPLTTPARASRARSITQLRCLAGYCANRRLQHPKGSPRLRAGRTASTGPKPPRLADGSRRPLIHTLDLADCFPRPRDCVAVDNGAFIASKGSVRSIATGPGTLFELAT